MKAGGGAGRESGGRRAKREAEERSEVRHRMCVSARVAALEVTSLVVWVFGTEPLLTVTIRGRGKSRRRVKIASMVSLSSVSCDDDA